MKVLVTGSAGFIGAALSARLLGAGHAVDGVDHLSPYYDVRLKQLRLQQLLEHPGYRHHSVDLREAPDTGRIFDEAKPEVVVHLAAQPGVRAGRRQPVVCIQNNVLASTNVFQASVEAGVQRVLYASSSSVYGANLKLPFAETQPTAHPLSLYAASKRACEVIAHSYSYLYRLPMLGMRFFTVYGPASRPDMAMFRFARAILRGDAITLFNQGKHDRSFTYIDDVVESIGRLLHHTPRADAGSESLCDSPVAPHALFNIGSAESVPLLHCVELLEQAFGRSAQKVLAERAAGDMDGTAAATERLCAAIDYQPRVSLAQGISHFADWFRTHEALLLRDDFVLEQA